MSALSAAEIHARLGGAWPAVLAQLGIAESALRPRKAGPCPNCGGHDRYTFDNRRGRGDFICRGCGAGDGFALLMRVHGWGFAQARARVLEAAHLAGSAAALPVRTGASVPEAAAQPTRRVREIARTLCGPEDVLEVQQYLASRSLWPLPVGCTLRAHARLEYWTAEQRRLGHYAALVAPVIDRSGELVTLHVTYFEHGTKLAAHTPRKILSPLTGRQGCAAQLMPLKGEVLGVSEGVENALSASALHEGLPVWAALNTSLLARFEPPQGVQRLVVFADRDVPGLEAAARLLTRLQGRVRIEICPPPPPSADWNDRLKELSL